MYKAILYPALSSRVILNNQARLACCYDQAPASGNVQGIPRETSREFGEFPGVPLEFPWNFPVISLDPLISLEFLWKIPWNSPGTFPGISLEFPGIPNSLEIPWKSLEFPWNCPGISPIRGCQGIPWNFSGIPLGNSLEFAWNSPGIPCNFSGISLMQVPGYDLLFNYGSPMHAFCFLLTRA